MTIDLFVQRRTFTLVAVGFNFNRWYREIVGGRVTREFLHPYGNHLWMTFFIGAFGTYMSFEFNPPNRWREIVDYSRKSIRGEVIRCSDARW